MSRKDFPKPQRTGVYIMRGSGDRVLYIGKAINLRNRINQYLRLQDSRDMVPRLVRELTDIEYILTNTEKEALLLERQLVKRLRPRYNVLLRDDKNFLLVRVDFSIPFPKFGFVRRKRKDRASYYGPYPSAKALRTYVRFISRAFRLRTCSDRQMGQRVRACMFYQTRTCSGPCVHPEENRDYGERMRHAVELLTKNRVEARKMLKQVMFRASDEERFEDAARYRDLLKSLNEIWGKQHVAISMPLDADVFAVYHGPLGGAVYILHIRDSAVVGSNSFFNEVFYSPDTYDLESLAYQFYENREPPAVIVGAFAPEAVKTVASLLREESGKKVSFVHPRRGDKKALLDMALENASLVYERESEKAKARHELLALLAATLGLPSAPEVVECVDISSFHGGDAVGSVAVARDGILVPKEYRCFHIRGDTSDDFAMMEEVVSRRMRQVSDCEEVRLLFVDGGRGHLARILRHVPPDGPVHAAAIAKARPRQGLDEDRVYLPFAGTPVDLKPDSRVMLFIASLRDEAHRFGIEFHRKKRSKRMLSSPLLSIPGVGKKRRMALVNHFGSFAKVKNAGLEELLLVRGLPKNVAEKIHQFFHGQSLDSGGGDPP